MRLAEPSNTVLPPSCTRIFTITDLRSTVWDHASNTPSRVRLLPVTREPGNIPPRQGSSPETPHPEHLRKEYWRPEAAPLLQESVWRPMQEPMWSANSHHVEKRVTVPGFKNQAIGSATHSFLRVLKHSVPGTAGWKVSTNGPVVSG